MNIAGPARLLTPDEAPAYTDLRRLMLVESPRSFGSCPTSDRVSDPAVVARSLAASGYAIAGAFEPPTPGTAHPRLLACAAVNREDRPKRSHIASVFSVYTRPEARRRGLSRAVIQLALATAHSWPGVRVIQLAVNPEASDAHGLYLSLGFVAWGQEPAALMVDGSPADLIHMRLEL